MNSTKVLESQYPEQFSDLFWNQPVFKVTKFPRHCLKEPFEHKPFPLKKEHVATPSNRFLNEEEEGKWIYHNKENLSLNQNAKQVNNAPKVEKLKSLQTRQLMGLIKIEKEVKLTDFDMIHQSELEENYDEERVALENEYGLPSDDIFEINETEEFEAQIEIAESYNNLNNSHPMNQENSQEEVQPSTETCDGLKKGIDNDAIIADISTMDGLSMFGDLLEINEKKVWEDEELENIKIFFSDLGADCEASENLTHFDCTISKCHEEDLEEEKINTHVNKTSSENFPMVVDFQDEDYEMAFESAFYISPLDEQSVPLMKKTSYRLNRGFSLFEDSPEMFVEDPSNRFKGDASRQRSYSKFTEDEWYKMDWRNQMIVDKADAYLQQVKDNIMQVDEPEYFRQFDNVLAGGNETPEMFEISGNFVETKTFNKVEHLDTISDNFKESVDELDCLNNRNFQIMNTDEENCEFSKTPVNDFSKTKIFQESSCF